MLNFPTVGEGQNGTTLTADVTATAHLTRIFKWTIEKTVSPETLYLFRGDTETVTYEIAVTKDTGTRAAYIEGLVTVNNGGAVATENLSITVNVTMPPNDNVIASTTVDLGTNTVIPAGGSATYTYSVDIPEASVSPGDTYKVTADVTITNHSGHLNTPFGPSPSTTTIMSTTETQINSSITVTDTNSKTPFSFNATGSQTYDMPYTCSRDDQAPMHTYTNTATIDQTGQSSSATVTVLCYDLVVSKTVDQTNFTRTYTWGIKKTATESNLKLALNESYNVLYTITATPSKTDSDFSVSGRIIVTNPNPKKPANVTVYDVSDSASGTVKPIGTVTIDASGSQTFTYITLLGNNGAGGTNRATARLNNIPTENGTTDFTATADFNFNNAVINLQDDCINVTDSLLGDLGEVCTAPGLNELADKTITPSPSYTIGPYTTCGNFEVNNTATFTTNNSGATGSASWSIAVTVPCVGGCTLTIGYWKTHAGIGPGHQEDMVTSLLPQWLGTAGGAKTVKVTTASQAVTILNFSGSASNGINRLYAQLLGAKLNIANGADGSAVASTIAAADAFLAMHNTSDWSSLTAAQRRDVNNWQGMLDQYNNGLIGPGHCSEDQTTASAAILSGILYPNSLEASNSAEEYTGDNTNGSINITLNNSGTIIINTNGRIITKNQNTEES